MAHMRGYKDVPQAAAAGEQWMSIPVSRNCPKGLEYLTVLDQVLVIQKVEKLEMFAGFETKNRFKIKNSLGQNVYWALEVSSGLSRAFLGSSRPFEMKILDNFHTEVMHIKRPHRFSTYASMIEVSAPPGNLIGTVERVFTWLKPTFEVKNSYGSVICTIVSPGITITSDVSMKIRGVNKEKIGNITKQWSGLGRELFTDADNFNVTFPINLDVHMKALLMAAVFLIDIVLYES